DGRQSFAQIFAGDGGVFFHQFVFARVLVENTGERGLEAGEMCSAAGRIDVVGEAENLLVVAVVVLEGDVDFDAVGDGVAGDDLLVNRRAAGVEVFDES